MISYIKLLMDLFRKSKSIDQSILAGSSFTGNYRADLGAGSAGVQSCLLDKGPEFIDLLIRDPLNFHSKTCGICNISVSEFLCSLSDSDLLISGDLSVSGHDPSGKIICAFVAEKAQSFHSLFIFFAYGKCCHKNFLLYSFLILLFFTLL